MIRRITPFVLIAALAALLPAAAHAQGTAAADQARRDSANRAFRHELYDTLAAAGVGNDAHGLLLVDGRWPGPTLQLRMLEGEVPDSALVRLYRAVSARAAAWPRDTLMMLLRLDADRIGDDPKGREHQPELKNRAEIANIVSRFAGTHSAVGARSYTFRPMLRMVVSRAGEVVFTEITESSGNTEVDTFVAGLGQRMRFEPARIGDQRVDVWVVLPVSITLPGSAM